MAWTNILEDKEFQEQSYNTRKIVASNYFDRKLVDEDFSRLPGMEQQRIRDKFIATIGLPDKISPIDVLKSDWRQGVFSTAMGLMGAEARDRGTMTPEQLMERYETLSAEMAEMQVPSNFDWKDPTTYPAHATRTTATLAPYMLRSMNKAAQYGAAGAMLGGTTMAILGQLGPQALTLEEVFTVPAGISVGGKLGARLGVVKSAMEVEGGNLYIDLINRGVPHDRAAFLSRAGGLAIGLLEISQVGRVVRGFLPLFSRKAAANLMANPNAAKIIATGVMRFGKDLGFEIAQEEAQELASVTAELIGTTLTEGSDKLTVSEVADRMLQTGSGALFGFPLLLAPGQVMTTGGQLISNAKSVQITEDQMVDPKAGLTRAPAVVMRGISEMKQMKTQLEEAPNDDLQAAYKRKEDEVITAWAEANPGDEGDALRQVFKDSELELAALEVSRITITDAEYEKGEFVVELPQGELVVRKHTPTVQRKDVDRVLTAVNWFMRTAPSFIGGLSRIEIVKGARTPWLNGVAKIVTGHDLGRLKNVSPKAYAELIAKYADKSGLFFTDKKGNKIAILRGENPQKKEVTTSRYIRNISHEAVHATAEADITIEEDEAAAEAISKATVEKFQREAPELEFQKRRIRRKEDVFVAWRSGARLGTTGSTFYSTRQIPGRVPYEVEFKNLLRVSEKEVGPFVGLPAEALFEKWGLDLGNGIRKYRQTLLEEGYLSEAGELIDDGDGWLMDIMVADEARRRGYDGIYYEIGDRLSKEGDIIQALDPVTELEFQEKVTPRPELERAARPTVTQRLRLEKGLGKVFTAIKRYDGQLFDEQGRAVNAAVDKDTGVLYLSGELEFSTIGHEAAELAFNTLGVENDIVKKGLEIFGGDKEALLDAVGDYYAERELQPALLKRVGNWLRELWSEFNRVRGMMAQEDVVRLLTTRTRHLGARKVQTRLRIFDVLDGYRGNINLEQLPLKNISSEEQEYIKYVAKRINKKVVTPQELKSALVNDMIEVRVEVELTPTASRAQRAMRAFTALTESRPAILQRVASKASLTSVEYEVLAAATWADVALWSVGSARQQQIAEAIADVVELPEGEQRLGILPEGAYTIPGIFNPATHVRLLFDTPINFEEEAHAGISSETAIGWAEVADAKDDPSTLIVFEVQPSDIMKEEDLTTEQRTFLYYDERQKKEIRLPAEQTGKINNFFYRALIQDAAVKGYKKIRFPTGGAIEAIEGTAAPVELYDRVAARIEKEYKGRTERVKEPSSAMVVDGLRIAKEGISEAVPQLAVGQSRRIAIPIIQVDLTIERFTETQYSVQVASTGVAFTTYSKEAAGKDNFISLVQAEISKLAPKPVSWLEVSLRSSDATEGALLYQHKKPANTKTSGPSKESRDLKETADEWRVKINLRDREWKNLYQKIKTRIAKREGEKESARLSQRETNQFFGVKLPERGSSDSERLLTLADNFMHSLNRHDRAMEMKQRFESGQGLTADESFLLSTYAANMFEQAVVASTVSGRRGAVAWAVNQSVGRTWIDLYEELGTYGSRMLAQRKLLSKTTKVFTVLKMLEESRQLTKHKREMIKQFIESGGFSNPRAATELADALNESNLRQVAMELMYSGILAVRTFTTNLWTNTAWQGWLMTVDRPAQVLAQQALVTGTELARTIFPTIPKYEQTVFFSDIAAMWKGAAVGPTGTGGVAGAWRLAGKVWRQEPIAEKALMSRWGAELGFYKGAFERSPHESIKKIGPLITTSLRGLIATDVFFRTIAADAELNAILEQKSEQTGVPKESITVTKEMMKRSTDYGLEAIFFNDPGVAGRFVKSAREFVPLGLGRLMMPFVTTLTNIMKLGIEFTPGLGLLGLRWSSGRNYKIIARQLQGAVFTMALFSILWDDDRFTGAPPRARAERDLWNAAKKIPYAFRVTKGGRWISYDRMAEPFTLTLSTMIAFRDAYKDHLKEKEKGKQVDWADAFYNIAHMVKNNIMDYYVAKNFIDIVKEESALKRFVRRLPSMFVPFSAFGRELNRTYEYIVNGLEGDAKIVAREKQAMLAYIVGSIPWYGITKKMPARINALGDEIELPGGALSQWLPVAWEKQLGEDSVEGELLRLEIYPGLPPKSLKIRGRDIYLTDELHREYVLFYGAALKESFRSTMNAKGYEALSDERKIKRLDSRSGKSRDRSRKRMIRIVRERGLDKR